MADDITTNITSNQPISTTISSGVESSITISGESIEIKAEIGKDISSTFETGKDIVIEFTNPIQGSAGTSGTSGSSGSSGISGTSGTSGLSGTSGTDGSHGTSGSSGSSGISGTDGSDGTSGTSGSSGSSGDSGTSGSSGTSGTSGSSGTHGTSGTSGTSGSSGTSGAIGSTGSGGTSGTSGSSGSSSSGITQGVSEAMAWFFGDNSGGGGGGATGSAGSAGSSGTSGTSPSTNASFTSINVGGNPSITEKVEVAGALASTDYSGDWGTGAERALFDFDYGTKFMRIISTGGSSGQANGIELYPGTIKTRRLFPTHTEELVPVCLTGNVQRFGINCYYDGSVWRLAAGTAKKAAVITVDIDLGVIDLYTSEVAKNVDEEITLEWQASFGSSVAWFPRIQTTASGANAFLDSTSYNSLRRSTSSLKYKQDVQDITIDEIDIISKLRPITFRSTCEDDEKLKRHFGFIAEEVAEIDTKTINYHDGQPDGLQYDRLIVPLVAYIQKLEKRIADLEARIL